MADNVQSVMLEILKRLQSDMSEVKARVIRLDTDMTDVKARQERLEVIATKQRRDSAAMLVIMRATVGDFDERVSKLEADVQALQDSR